MKMTSQVIEIALANHFNWRMNFIIPNISWGLHLQHEADLLIITPAKYAYEIEIKISKSDLKRDLLKKHGHKSLKLKRLYFAVPDYLENDAKVLIPEHAGLFIIDKFGFVKLIKAPKLNTEARKLTDLEMEHLYHLATMRIWSLKEALRFAKEKHYGPDKEA